MLRILVAAALFAAPGLSQVVINEFQYDDAGATDNFEFVELYNAGAPVDISNWTLVMRDATSAAFGGLDPDVVFTISPGSPLILPTGGFFVLGSAAVPNVTQTIADTSLENDNESLELYNNLAVLQDSLCYEIGLGTFGPHPVEPRGFYGDLAVGDGPSSSIARIFDGFDTNRNSTDFSASVQPTPGATNQVASVLPYFENFDSGFVPGTIPGWHRGFVFPNYVDPTIPGTQNVQAKPASPQGGLAMMTWDSSGGGNTVTLATAPVSDVVVECYAFLYPLMTPVNPTTSPYNATIVTPGQYNWADGEYWAIGARGSSAANGNPANVPGTYFADIALGVATRYHHATGLAWVHYRTRSYSRLFLVDLKDGASFGNPNFTVLAGPIDIVAGVNDGWQRLRLHLQGNEVIANFGGTYGNDDGQRFYATTTTTGPGQIYIAYREAVLSIPTGPSQGPHPPAFDAFSAHAPTTTKTFFGVGSPLSNSNVPQIGAAGFATLGSTGFTVKGSNMIPFPNNISLLVVSTLGFPPGYPIPGAPPGTTGYVVTFDLTLVNLPDAFGNVSDVVQIPGDPGLLGFPITSQYAVLDSGLTAFSLAIAVSQAMETVIGN